MTTSPKELAARLRELDERSPHWNPEVRGLLIESATALESLGGGESAHIHTWGRRSDGKLGCDYCCTGDRCDDRTHVSRANCKHCGGTGALPPAIDPQAAPTDWEAGAAKLKAEVDASMQITEEDLALRIGPAPIVLGDTSLCNHSTMRRTCDICNPRRDAATSDPAGEEAVRAVLEEAGTACIGVAGFHSAPSSQNVEARWLARALAESRQNYGRITVQLARRESDCAEHTVDWGRENARRREVEDQLAEAKRDGERLRGYLERIASGSPPTGEMPSLEGEPAEFRSAMWTWSEKHAREGLAASASEPSEGGE